MRRILPLLFTLLALAIWAAPANGTAEQQVTQTVDYAFGGQINFHLSLPAGQELQAVQVSLRSQRDEEIIAGEMLVEGSQATYVHDLSTQPLRAFSIIEYWFTVTLLSGETFTTDTSSFLYVDNRFQWQVLEDDTFRVHWYAGDVSFGQSVLEAAREGAERARSLLPVGEIQPVDIYVYASGNELQSTLRLGGLNWVAGHANPDMNLMVVSLPAGPDQKSETVRQIPHELMHILLYQAVGDGYYQVPTWYKEGIASANELNPNSDYYLILQRAITNDSLISLGQLCESFPQDSSVYLAYAESDSFVRYLQRTYGASGLGSLLQSYANGGSCEQGSEAAIGLPLERLENDWRRDGLGEFAWLSALINLLPWLLVLGVVIIAPLTLMVINLRKKNAKRDSKVSYG